MEVWYGIAIGIGLVALYFLSRSWRPMSPERALRGLRNADARIRQASVEELGMKGPEGAPAIGELAALVNDPEPGVRRAVAESLGAIGSTDDHAVEALERLCGDPDKEVAGAAQWAREWLEKHPEGEEPASEVD